MVQISFNNRVRIIHQSFNNRSIFF